MKARTMMFFGMLAALGLVIAGCDKKGEGTKGKGAEAGKSGATSRKLSKEALEELLKLEVSGFEQQPGPKIMEMGGIAMVTVYYKGTKGNAQEMTAFAQVRMHSCGHCPELTAASFKAEKGIFEKMMLSSVHKDSKDAVFEIKDATIAGKKAVTIYQLSFHVSEDGKSRSSSHGFSVYHHDGRNMLHVMISPRAVTGFKSAENLDELKSQFSREEMVAAATTFMETLGSKIF